MSYDVITIGSGLGGLVSSALLAKRGKRVLLLERHGVPGGYCTSYQRSGYTFSIPSVIGLPANNGQPSPLAELGLYDGVRWNKIDNFARYIYPGVDIAMPTCDLDRCQQNLCAIFPDEASAVASYFADVRRVSKHLRVLQASQRTFGQVLSLIGAAPGLASLARVSFFDYMRRRTASEKLIGVLASFWGYAGLPPGRISALAYLMMSGETMLKPLYYPADGYQAIPNHLAAKLAEYGGEVRYHTGVRRILVRDGEAIGVETDRGERIGARCIVSNADTRKTFLDLVGADNLHPRFAARVQAHTPSASGISLHLGVNLDLSRLDLRYGSIFFSEAWQDDDAFYDRNRAGATGLDQQALGIGLQAPSLLSDRLAPPGKHILHVLVMPVSPRYLEDLSVKHGGGKTGYRAAKRWLAEVLVARIEPVVPGLSRSIEVTEMATPTTFERYTSASGGAWYDGVREVGAGGSMPQVATPIGNLYLTGTKALGGGGLPPAMLGGVMTAEAVFKATRRAAA